MNLIRTPLLLLLAAGMLSCSTVVIKVKKNDDGAENQAAQAAGKSADQRTGKDLEIRDVAAYLKDTDSLKDDLAELILDELRGDFRPKFRKAMRDVRASIIKNATAGHSYRNDLFAELNDAECSDLDEEDLKAWAEDKALGAILKGSLLARLSRIDAGKLKIKVPDDLMAEVRSIFDKEMGFSHKGDTVVTETGNKTTTTSTVIWQISSEGGESAEDTAMDHLDVQFSFVWVKVDGEDRKFSVRVDVQAGLYEGAPTGDSWFLDLASDNNGTGQDGYEVSSRASAGKNDVNTYSRRMDYARDGANKDLYELKDYIRYGTPEMELREATINLDEWEKCVKDKLD